MDISSMLVGKSEQLDNVDLISGPRDFTITAVGKGPADQPLNIALAEFDRPWRPGLTMRRLLAAMWGKDASTYVGKRVRLYRDADVTFGKDKPGGTRISHASHLDRPFTVVLPISRGKVDTFRVDPLPEEPARPFSKNISTPLAEPADIATLTDRDALKAMWKAHPEQRAAIEARVAELNQDGAP